MCQLRAAHHPTLTTNELNEATRWCTFFLPWHEAFLHEHELRVIQLEKVAAFQFQALFSLAHWIAVYIDCWLFRDLLLLHPMSMYSWRGHVSWKGEQREESMGYYPTDRLGSFPFPVPLVIVLMKLLLGCIWYLHCVFQITYTFTIFVCLIEYIRFYKHNIFTWRQGCTRARARGKIANRVSRHTYLPCYADPFSTCQSQTHICHVSVIDFARFLVKEKNAQ